jgi:hypothetical protein
MMAALMGQDPNAMGMGGNGMNPMGQGMAVQSGTGMMAGGPTMQQAMPGMGLQQPGMGGNPAAAAQQAGQPGTGLSQQQKMMMAQSLMNMGQQGKQSAPQVLPMNVGRNT